MITLCSGLPSLASEDWREVERKDDGPQSYVLYVGGADDARYPSYRLETELEATPEEAAESLLLVMTAPEFVPDGREREVLRRTENEILVHTLIDMPLPVSDRDVGLRIRRARIAETGIQRVTWESIDEGLPEPRNGVVRFSASGFWEFRPDGPGRSRGTYVSHSDPAGLLPPWLVRRMMQDQISGDLANLRGAIVERRRAVAAPPPKEAP